MAYIFDISYIFIIYVQVKARTIMYFKKRVRVMSNCFA